MPDLARIRRESMRWNLINTLNKFRPYTTHEARVVEVMQAIYPDATPHEVRLELDYLADRALVAIDRRPQGAWYVDITRLGVDLAEYTIICEPGIARPDKYWAE